MININTTNLKTRLASTTIPTKIEGLKSSDLTIVLEKLLDSRLRLKPMHIAHFLMGKISLENLELSEDLKKSIMDTNIIEDPQQNCFFRRTYIRHDIATTLKKDILKSGEYFGSWTESSKKTSDKLNFLLKYLKDIGQDQQGIEVNINHTSKKIKFINEEIKRIYKKIKHNNDEIKRREERYSKYSYIHNVNLAKNNYKFGIDFLDRLFYTLSMEKQGLVDLKNQINKHL